MEISSQWPETEGFFARFHGQLWPICFLHILVCWIWFGELRALLPFWGSWLIKFHEEFLNEECVFVIFCHFEVWEALGLQATSNKSSWHLIYSRVVYFVAFCLVPFQTIANQRKKKGDINHQTWPSDILQLTFVLLPVKAPQSTCHVFPTWNKPHQHVLQPFRKKHTSFLLPKSASWPIASWWSLSELIFQPRIWCWEFWASASHQLGTPVFDSLTLQWYLCFGVYKSYKFR